MNTKTKKELEIEKLLLEARKNKNPFYNIEFYKTIIALVAVIGTIIFSWQSGLFDVKEKQLKLDATILELRKMQLTISVDSLESQKSKISDTLNKMNHKLLSAEFEMSNLENNLVRIKHSLSNTEYLLLVKKVDVALDNIKNELLKETPNSNYSLEQDYRYISLYPKFNTIIQNRIKSRIQNEFINNSNILIRIYGFRIMSLFVKNEYITEWSKYAMHYIDSFFLSNAVWYETNLQNEFLFGPKSVLDSNYIETVLDFLISINNSDKSAQIIYIINYISDYFNFYYPSIGKSINTINNNVDYILVYGSERIYRKYISYLMYLAVEQRNGFFGRRLYSENYEITKNLNLNLNLNCFQILVSYFIEDVYAFYIKRDSGALYNIREYIAEFYEPSHVPRGADSYFYEKQRCLSNYFLSYNLESPTNEEIVKIGRDSNIIPSFIKLFDKPNWNERIKIWTDPRLTYFNGNGISIMEKIKAGEF